MDPCPCINVEMPRFSGVMASTRCKFLSAGKSVQKIFFSSAKTSYKNAKSRVKPPIVNNFKDKIKILSTYNLLCRKFAVSVAKLQFAVPLTSQPPTPLTRCNNKSSQLTVAYCTPLT